MPTHTCVRLCTPVLLSLECVVCLLRGNTCVRRAPKISMEVKAVMKPCRGQESVTRRGPASPPGA